MNQAIMLFLNICEKMLGFVRVYGHLDLTKNKGYLVHIFRIANVR